MEKQTVKIFKGDECIGEVEGERALAIAVKIGKDGNCEIETDSGCGMGTVECLAIWLMLAREIQRETEMNLEKMIMLLRANNERKMVEEIGDADGSTADGKTGGHGTQL